MASPGRPVTALTVSLVYLLTLFGSYCQMAPAVASATRGWSTGSGFTYKLTNTLLFREAGPPKSGGDVGFQLTGELDITAVWKDPQDLDTFLLKLQLQSPKLWIKSRKAPEPEGFVEHSSRVDDTAEKPVLVLWKHGEVRSIYLDDSESISSLNLKRGLASLLQYRTLDDEITEEDSSGSCRVVYESTGPRTIVKRKSQCTQKNLLPPQRHPNPIFDVALHSSRNSTYELTQSLLPKIIQEEERHELTLVASPTVGSVVTSRRVLEIVNGVTRQTSVVTADSVKRAVASAQPGYRQFNIQLQQEPVTCPDSGCKTLDQIMEENRESLSNKVLGTAKSASGFLKLAPLVKNASPDELAKLLKTPKYRDLRNQLLDIYGSTSSMAAHQAAMKTLRQDESGEETERYLWALSLSPSPDPDIFKDILKRSEATSSNDKVSETMALTAAAMAHRYGNSALTEKARVSLETGLESCTGEECKLKFLRALRNLRSKTAIPVLLDHAVNGSRATSVIAWRALKALPEEHITPEVKEGARRIFFQLGGPKRDSSVRTLAADIILENKPTKKVLLEFVDYLTKRDPAFEVRKYLSQRLEQISAKCPEFAKNLRSAFGTLKNKVYNYNVMAFRGLSTAFTRDYMNSSGSYGSLVTVQEVNSGLLKRGIVDVMLATKKHEQAIFSLGLFAGGLGSFVSSNQEDQDPQSEDETATAGMEIDVLGVGVRPFVFFSGQGELMGHVWSGTASERTPAFQVLASLYSHSEFVPLASGFVAELDVQGAISFDLAGQIQLSLWSRNAQSLVEMGAGIAVHGGTKVRSNIVQSTAEFLLTVEPKLELSTDVDFSGPVSLCMRLSQPETTVRHQVYKVERIPGSRHRLRKTRRSKLLSPAKSYLLNRKNNEMCSKVFS
ncbi:microsomal triacylglycerol transfer protein [Prorops nasuta]|uniref:microsomal triacylglycerol transfer protein n=1 Tax=Prorops nasuta TaxID=863751 RepID=UPI0034CD849C